MFESCNFNKRLYTYIIFMYNCYYIPIYYTTRSYIVLRRARRIVGCIYYNILLFIKLLLLFSYSILYDIIWFNTILLVICDLFIQINK